MITRCSIPLLFSLFVIACGTTTPRVEFAGSTRPYGGAAHVIPGLIEAEHYDEGKPGEAYYDNDETNHGAGYRGRTHVDIEQRPDASNGYGIGWTSAGEWLAYTVIVREEGTYTVEFPVASDQQGGTFHLEMDGVDVTGPIEVPDTGAWTKLEMIRREHVRLKAGVFVMKIVMDANGASGGIGDIDYIRFVRSP